MTTCPSLGDIGQCLITASEQPRLKLGQEQLNGWAVAQWQQHLAGVSSLDPGLTQPQRHVHHSAFLTEASPLVFGKWHNLLEQVNEDLEKVLKSNVKERHRAFTDTSQVSDSPVPQSKRPLIFIAQCTRST